MKKLTNTMTKLLTGALVACLGLTFNACTTEQSPMSVDIKEAPSERVLNILQIGDDETRLRKSFTVSQFVTKKDGGELIIDYKGYEQNNGNVEVKMTLKIFSKTISQGTQLVMSLDDQGLLGNVDVTFHPHGITFDSPALLNIEAKNLDLSGVNPDDIKLYYDNPETGEWEVMQSKEVIVKEDEGYVKIIDGELPHFSRYAVAWAR